MTNCPLYNGENLNFTGKYNPYGLIQNNLMQNGGKRRKSRRVKKTVRKNKKGNKRNLRKTRKYNY
jgi:hypothetical protein